MPATSTKASPHLHSATSPDPSANANAQANANPTTLIARAEALNAFMNMQPAAADHAARSQGAASPLHSVPVTPAAVHANAGNPSVFSSPPVSASKSGTTARRTATSKGGSTQPLPRGCFCFGSGGGGTATSTVETPSCTNQQAHHQQQHQKPLREYYPDNLSVQPRPHPWEDDMEWLIIACVTFLETHNGTHERNLFAVSAVDDLVRSMKVAHVGSSLPAVTDPHVAAGVIKMKIRHAESPLIDKACLRQYIDSQQQHVDHNYYHTTSFAQSHLKKTVDDVKVLSSTRRAYVLARLMRLLGRVSANVEYSGMNAHCLAKCVAPSMLHWDPNSAFALLMLGKITAYVMAMIDDARTFDELLGLRIEELEREGGGW